MKQQLINFYLDWFNHYFTISVFAEHNGLTEETARQLLEIGKQLYHEANRQKLKWKNETI